MLRNMNLEYWMDDSWFVGRLKEMPHVFSQGELIENIKDAYQLVLAGAATRIEGL